MRKSTLSILTLAGLTLAANVTPVQAQATRTWVSGVGDDVNPCSRTAPCKTFAGAISKTAAGGIINCLDPGGFGTVTITKSMTIDCEGTFGGVLASGTNGININDSATAAPGSIEVVLRNLHVEGAPAGASAGFVGINFVSGKSVRVERSHIYGFTTGNGNGIRVATASNVSAVLIVHDSYIADNTNGIVIVPSGNGSVTATINRTTIDSNVLSGLTANSTGTTGAVNVVVRESSASNNGDKGVFANASGQLVMAVDKSSVNGNSIGINSTGTNSRVRLANTIVAGNNTGLQVASSGKIISFLSNMISANISVDGAPTATVSPE